MLLPVIVKRFKVANKLNFERGNSFNRLPSISFRMDITDHRIPFYPLERQLWSGFRRFQSAIRHHDYLNEEVFAREILEKFYFLPLLFCPKSQQVNGILSGTSIGFLKRVERFAFLFHPSPDNPNPSRNLEGVAPIFSIERRPTNATLFSPPSRPLPPREFPIFRKKEGVEIVGWKYIFQPRDCTYVSRIVMQRRSWFSRW